MKWKKSMIPAQKEKVEIIIRPIEETKRIENFFTFLNSLPKGTRSKESIDLQIKTDRSSWD